MKRAATIILALVGIAVVITGMVFLWIEPRETIFVVSALGAVVGSVIAVTRRNPLYSIVALLAVFLCLALLFWVLAAVLLAALQLIVYGGAILMLFLFVIMLFNLDSPDPAKELGELDVAGRLTAEEAERETTGFLFNTPRTRALFLSVLVGVLLIVPILMLEDPPEPHLPHWNRFLPLSHEGISDALESRLRAQVTRELRQERLPQWREEMREDEEAIAALRTDAEAELAEELAALEGDAREERLEQAVQSRLETALQDRLTEEIAATTRRRLVRQLEERAAYIAREIKHKTPDERDEIITVGLGRRLGELMHIQEVDDPYKLDFEAAVVLRKVRELDRPQLDAQTQELFAQQLRPMLEAIHIDDKVRQEIYVELAVRGRLGPHFGSIPGVGTELMEKQVLSLEYIGLLILAGCVGVAMLARRRTEEEEQDDEETEEEEPAPLPSP